MGLQIRVNEGKYEPKIKQNQSYTTLEKSIHNEHLWY